MRQFLHPNMNGFTCPVCGTNADAPVVLVPIEGTEDGNLVEAKQVHSDCYRVMCRMRGIDVIIEE